MTTLITAAKETIYLAARLARQWIKERGIIACALSVKFVYLAARWARREIVVTKTCRIIKTNGCYDQFHISGDRLSCERRPISGCYWCRQRRQATAKNSSQASDQRIKFAGTHLYTWVERGTVRVKCLAQEHNTMSPARARTRTARSGVKRTNHEATAPSLDLTRTSTEFASEISAPRISTSFECHLDFLVNLGEVGVYHVCMCFIVSIPYLVMPRHRFVMMH